MNAKSTLVALAVLLLFACKKETETPDYEKPASYLPLRSGKYITYLLDSTIFTNFGATKVIRSYQEKHQVDTLVTDNLGRPSYRVFRFLRNAAGTGSWQPAGTYFITPTANTIELVENNLRFVKLVTPVKEGTSWKGNMYLPDEPYSSQYDFSNDNFMAGWEHTYAQTGASLSLNGKSYTNVARVVGIDDNKAPDTLDVTGTQVQIPPSLKTIYLRGSASGPVTLNMAAPTVPGTVTIYNRSNQTATLASIDIPAGGGKSFEYIGGRWTFGYVNIYGQRKDTLYFDLPYASRDLSVDAYARDLGLIYQELVMWEYQPPTAPRPGFRGFGVKRSIIDHN